MPTGPADRASPPEAGATDLPARIRAAELRLITREENLQRRFGEVSSRVKSAVQPKRLVLPLAGIILAGVALWWLVRGRRTALPAAPGHSAAQAHEPVHPATPMPTQLLSIPLMGLVWPLLPGALRRRLNPIVASALVIGLPLVRNLVARPAGPPPAAMAWIDLPRYAGTWFEVARLPAPFEGAGKGQPTVEYVLRDDGGIDVINRCTDGGGLPREARGEARTVPGGGGAKLEVSLWPHFLRGLPFAWADHWILHVDDDYSEALVGSPSRRCLRVLSREPTLPRERMLRLVQMAQARGYPVERLKFVEPR